MQNNLLLVEAIYYNGHTMPFVRNHAKELLLGSCIFLFFLISRLIALTNIPIFTDEAIYLRWAQIANQDANWRFISLTDGKGTLFIWFVMAAMRIVNDPLVAGRLVSVAAGLMSMVGLFFLSRELFKNKWIGITAAGLYALSPFALVYDRLALYDSLVGTFAIWGLYISVLLIRHLRLDLAFILGFITGAAVLNKSNGFFTLYLFPFTLLLFDFRKKYLTNRLLKLGGLFLVVVALTYGIYSILRLSPFFYLIAQKNMIFIHPISEVLKNPFAFVFQNTRRLGEWFMIYMQVVWVIGVLAAFIVQMKFLREKLLLAVCFLFPFAALAFFGNTIYPRYLFFMVLPLLPLLAYTLVVLFSSKQKIVGWGVTALMIIVPLYTNVMLLTNFSKAFIPQIDISQLYSDWPAGGGVNESIAFFKEQADKHGKIYIATAGSFGLMPYAYELYLVQDPRFTIKGIWPIETTPPQEVVEASKTMPTYFVFYQECVNCPGEGLAPTTWPLKQVLQVKKPATDTYLTVYQLTN